MRQQLLLWFAFSITATFQAAQDFPEKAKQEITALKQEASLADVLERKEAVKALKGFGYLALPGLLPFLEDSNGVVAPLGANNPFDSVRWQSRTSGHSGIVFAS